MFDIVIVEDKKVTREGLVHLMDWASLDARVVGAFDSGQAAIEFLSRNKAHIVITDIEMENGTGMELSAYICERMPQTKVIIISAYERFSYAHQAIQLGVFAYQLKPVDEKELLDKVSNAISQIRKDQEAHALASLLALQELSSTLEAYLMNRPVDYSLLQQAFEVLQSELDHNIAAVFVLRGYGEHISMRKLKEEVANSDKKIMLMQCGALLTGVIFYDKPLDSYYFESLYKIFKFRKKVRIGAGIIVCDANQIKESYESALQAYRYGFLHNLGLVTFYEQIQNDLQLKRKSYKTIYLDCSYLIKCIEAEWDAEALEYIESMMVKWRDTNSSITHMINQCSECVFRLSSELSVMENFTQEAILADFELMTNLTELKSYMLEVLGTISNEVKKKQLQKIRPIVKLALSYSVEHIEVGLNLKFIASKLNTSYVYLSKAFKEDIHIGYTEYMNMYRIELAKKHLANPYAKVGDVCARIGLEQKNFHFLFKKLTGMTPKEYQGKRLPVSG
ncbi:response regulator transcription factor [Paenibacillus oceani]|uniref:Response regulator n=1 Tax=Paenibacillus oceani TaxID=2772510 RepID=A0A927CBS9_9BACL|nr:response regulator [Paenibacillus oceani]MBD2863768.1 response regulator [Paenibacillus oceani]